MKLLKIVQAVDNLDKLTILELPAKESFKVLNLLMEIEPHIQNYHTQRNKLLAKYGESTDGKEYQIKIENKDKFIAELKDLEDIEIELKFEKINIPEDLKIKASDIVNILDFIKVGD
jgi:hypothetical protein